MGKLIKRSQHQPMSAWFAVSRQCAGSFHVNQYPSKSSSSCAVSTALSLAAATLVTKVMLEFNAVRNMAN